MCRSARIFRTKPSFITQIYSGEQAMILYRLTEVLDDSEIQSRERIICELQDKKQIEEKYEAVKAARPEWHLRLWMKTCNGSVNGIVRDSKLDNEPMVDPKTLRRS